MDDLIRGHDVGELQSPELGDLLADLDAEPRRSALWGDRVRSALAQRSDAALDIAEEALRACPGDFNLLLLSALAALAAAQPTRALAFIKRHQKRFVPGRAVTLLHALTFAQQRQFTRAKAMLRANGTDTLQTAADWFVGRDIMLPWLRERLLELRLELNRAALRPAPRAPVPPPAPRQPRASVVGPPSAPSIPDLPRLEARFDVQVELADTRGDRARWRRLGHRLVPTARRADPD